MSGPAVDRLEGVLLGTALGDALGLPAEGMSAGAIRRRFGRVDRFRLLGATGFVSDDTELSALVAQSLAGEPDDPGRCATAFRKALVGWFARLPFGVGLGTARACLRAAIGLRPSGVRSAGNGAATRAAVVGVFFRDRPDAREAFGRALAEVTHRDPRAVAGALFVTELAAFCARSGTGTPRIELFRAARESVRHDATGAALDRAEALAAEGASVLDAAGILGTSGYVLHSVPFAAYVFLKADADALAALADVISAGGDADSNAAILGAWLGALRGGSGLPPDLLSRIHDGPFGPTHLRALARRLDSGAGPVPSYSATAATARNLALLPVILGHGLLRIVPASW